MARNGQEFEAMTKQKQRNNPRFAFLFGGEFYNYYMYRVTTEQAVLKHKAAREQQQQQQQHQGPSGGNFGHPNFGNSPAGLMNQQAQRFPGHPQMPNNRGPVPMQGFDRGGFDQRPPNNFDQRHIGPGPGMQNFERPQINRMPFQQQLGPRPQGNFAPTQGGFFERPQQALNVPRAAFDVDQRNSFQQNPGPGAAFDRVVIPQFQQAFTSQAQPAPTVATVAVSVSVVTPTPTVTQPPSAQTVSIDTLQAQKQALEDQIRQSEQNLAGQHQVLLAQQQKQIEESIRIMQDAEIKTLATELNVNLEEFDAVLAPIAENCTKDSISSGKAWIFTHTSTPRHYKLVSQYLLRK